MEGAVGNNERFVRTEEGSKRQGWRKRGRKEEINCFKKSRANTQECSCEENFIIRIIIIFGHIGDGGDEK
jgi:hypothetical protein